MRRVGRQPQHRVRASHAGRAAGMIVSGDGLWQGARDAAALAAITVILANPGDPQ